KQAARDKMQAIVHVDGTARLQTVSREQNPLFARLLEELGRIKGVPCVLNTSFNIKGEPIVCTPMDAVKCWASTGLDALVMGPFVLEKQALSLPEVDQAAGTAFVKEAGSRSSGPAPTSSRSP